MSHCCKQAAEVRDKAAQKIKEEQVSESDDDAPLRPMKSRSLKPSTSKPVEPQAVVEPQAEREGTAEEEREFSQSATSQAESHNIVWLY